MLTKLQQTQKFSYLLAYSVTVVVFLPYMSNTRRNKRANERIHQTFLSELHNRAKSLSKAVITGYQERLNRYLAGCTKAFIAEIGYDKVRLTITENWQVPTEEQRATLEKARNIKLKPNEQVCFIALERKHYKQTPKVKEYPVTSQQYNVWANVGFRTADLDTKQKVEIVMHESLVGYLAEKGIEYIEAERSHRETSTHQPAQKTGKRKTAQSKTAKAAADTAGTASPQTL